MNTIEDNDIEFVQTVESLKSTAPVSVFDLFYKKEKDDKIRQYVFNEYFEWVVGLVNKFKTEWLVLCSDPSIKEHFYQLAEYCDNLREKPDNSQEFKEKLKVCANAYRLMDFDGINCGIWNFYRWETIEDLKNEWDSFFCFINRRLSKQCDYLNPKIRGFGEPKWRVEDYDKDDALYESDLTDRENSYGIEPRPEIDLDHDYDKRHRIHEITYHIHRAYRTFCDPEVQDPEKKGCGAFYKYAMVVDCPVEGIPDFITNKENKQFWDTIKKFEVLTTKYGTFFKEGLTPENCDILDDNSDKMIDVNEFL